MLRPQHLFGLDVPPLVHGVIWSLLLNILGYIGFSLHRQPSAIERLQANTFRSFRPDTDCAELPALALFRDGRGADDDDRALSR